MNKIIEKKILGPNVILFTVEAPRIARARRCGQFIIVRAFEHSERIPLTIAATDPDADTITFIVQTVGKSTMEMGKLERGQDFQDIAGPLGQPSHIDNYGTTVVIGGGVGTAVVYPQAVALREAGNRVISIIGARTKELVILEDLMKTASDSLIVTTDDGSYGQKGFVTTALKSLIESEHPPVDAVYCAGPVIMMKAVAEVTRPYRIPTIVSLNPIMVDGTGMCGGCRVTVGGERHFACVEGPEFDGHQVDFDELMDRLQTYRHQESQSLKHYQQSHSCQMKTQKANVDRDAHEKSSA